MSWDNTTLFVDDNPADRAFRQEVRDWVADNLPADLCNRPFRIDPPELKPWHRKLYERGWIAPHWPKNVGGMGATLTQQIILFEEISRVGAPTPYPHGLNFIGPLIIDAGTPAQKAQHLPPILTGEATWCQGYSESGAGSDLASLATRAELDGDDFVVNGHKMWTTNGHFADWMFALVRTDPKAQPRHAGITMLLIDLKSPGITVRPIQTIKGDAEFAEEFFVDVRVPRVNMLGGLNEGWKVANKLLGSERFTTGHPRNAAVLLNEVRQVGEFSGALREPAFRHKLAALEIDLLAFSAYYRHAAALHGHGKGAAVDGAGDQDRRRRARPARLRTAGGGRRAVRPRG
jgi:alkylation response protein AidB-like acyl-CoA dehydrogenase